MAGNVKRIYIIGALDDDATPRPTIMDSDWYRWPMRFYIFIYIYVMSG